jgi:hypothetical protein
LLSKTSSLAFKTESEIFRLKIFARAEENPSSPGNTRAGKPGEEGRDITQFAAHSGDRQKAKRPRGAPMSFRHAISTFCSLNKLNESRSTSVLLLSGVLVALSLAIFGSLEQLIIAEARSGGFKGDDEDLVILDRRDGYTPEEIRKMLKAWGSGCWLVRRWPCSFLSGFHRFHGICMIPIEMQTHGSTSVRTPGEISLDADQ